MIVRVCGRTVSRRSCHVTRHVHTTIVNGDVGTPEFNIQFVDASESTISPWHDIELKGAKEGEFNFVCEVPKISKAKMEIDTKAEGNPIVQDTKKGKLRYYHGPIYWNYGCIPQTWEDPSVRNADVDCFGDNDPLDVVEIGSNELKMGSVTSVKPLGILSMIDDGELDWKLIAIDSNDPLANELNDVSDVETKLPGTISGIREWFRWYKVPDGKPLNQFGHGEVALGRDVALEVIEETHEFWKNLREGKADRGKLWL